jgi:hypothetical protein
MEDRTPKKSVLNRDGWGVRVRRPFGARGMSSVRYGIRLGDLKNKQSTHTHGDGTELGSVTLKRVGLFCFPTKHSTHTVSESSAALR